MYGTGIHGPCPDSVAATKESSFFKLGKEGGKRERREIIVP
jgi:hypothetical protein